MYERADRIGKVSTDVLELEVVLLVQSEVEIVIAEDDADLI